MTTPSRMSRLTIAVGAGTGADSRRSLGLAVVFFLHRGPFRDRLACGRTTVPGIAPCAAA